jgi:hypothetical protein
MAHINIIPTSKPSRLYLTKEGFYFLLPNIKGNDVKFQHIYITSDEEIKEGDWFYCFQNNNTLKCFKKEEQVLNGYHTKYTKIILTTDPDLIADGVQAIDDEFLEWFVKNPSCESIEVVKEINKSISAKEPYYKYKIIIPEEIHLEDIFNDEKKEGIKKLIQKQKLIDMMEQDEQLGLYQETIEENCCTPVGQIKRYVDCKGCDRKPKQETPEEVAERLVKETTLYGSQEASIGSSARSYFETELRCVLLGMKWQMERSYSEEEVFNLLMELSSRDINSYSRTPHSVANWFEQFKKK